MEAYRTYLSILTNHYFVKGDEKGYEMYNEEIILEYVKNQSIQIIAGSVSDKKWVGLISTKLEELGIYHQEYYLSAHRNTEQLMKLLKINPSKLYITVAGRSNALSGVVSANTKVPVIACPPFKDKMDMMVNINSTLQMPSNVPVLTILDPGNAALAVQRILSLSL